MPSKTTGRPTHTHCQVCGGKFYETMRVPFCEDCMDREDHEAVERVRAFARRLRENQGRPTAET